MSKETVLHDCHARLGGRIVDFHGWMLPVQYQGVLGEHRHCRTAAVVFDTSHMGQFLLTGPDAEGQIARIATQDAAAMGVGTCRYGFLLNESGGVLDDTILMRLGEGELLMVVNAGTAGGDLAWLGEHLAGEVSLSNLSDQGWGKVDLQGPAALDVLAPLCDAEVARLNYFTARRCRCCGRDCVIARTGYTGELGYEIMACGEDLVAIFERLAATPPVMPAGLGARDSLRMEMCYPLYGSELSEAVNPIDAGLGDFVDLSRQFIGVDALRSVARRGADRKLVALRAESRRRGSAGDRIVMDGRIVGQVTSGAFSPSLEVSIALGFVHSEAAKCGTELVIRTARAELPVTVREKPLYHKGTCRTKRPLVERNL